MSEQVTITAKQVIINAEQITSNVKDVKPSNAVGIGFGVLILYFCLPLIWFTGLGIGSLLFSILGVILMAGNNNPIKDIVVGMCILGALFGFVFFLMP